MKETISRREISKKKIMRKLLNEEICEREEMKKTLKRKWRSLRRNAKRMKSQKAYAVFSVVKKRERNIEKNRRRLKRKSKAKTEEALKYLSKQKKENEEESSKKQRENEEKAQVKASESRRRNRKLWNICKTSLWKKHCISAEENFDMYKKACEEEGKHVNIKLKKLLSEKHTTTYPLSRSSNMSERRPVYLLRK